MRIRHLCLSEFADVKEGAEVGGERAGKYGFCGALQAASGTRRGSRVDGEQHAVGASGSQTSGEWWVARICAVCLVFLVVSSPRTFAT